MTYFFVKANGNFYHTVLSSFMSTFTSVNLLTQNLFVRTHSFTKKLQVLQILKKEGFLKVSWEKENCWQLAFSPCPRMLSTVKHHLGYNNVSSALFFFFNPFPNKPWFLYVCGFSLTKTLWEKKKLLLMTNFSFSHSVFYFFAVSVLRKHCGKRRNFS